MEGDGAEEMESVLRMFEIRVERFAGGGSEVVTVEAVNRASSWSKAAAQVDDPDNIRRMEMLSDSGIPLRVGLDLPNGEPDFYGGVPVDEAVEQAHAPRFPPASSSRGAEPDNRSYEFWFTMFTLVEARANAFARNRAEAWSIAAFDEAVGQISVLELQYVSAPTDGAGLEWETFPIYGDIPYGGVTVDLVAGHTAIDLDSIAEMRQRTEEDERHRTALLFREVPHLVAVVFGGSSGVGRLVAEFLAREGVRIAIVGSQQADLDIVAADFASRTGAEVLSLVADAKNSEQVRSMAQRVRDHFGKVDIVVNLPVKGVEDDAEVMGSDVQRAIELFGLPPDNTGFLRQSFHESIDDELLSECWRPMLLIPAAGSALVLNFLRST
jgi:hypothetical protein